MPELSVAVVGGGITGLATAWFLEQADPSVNVTVYEASSRVGGKIQTEELLGLPVEAGPDTFLARVPWAVDLCRQLDLASELVTPATGQAYIWTRGRLRPLPEGTVLGVPARLGPLARSKIVSPLGLARAGLDAVLPATRLGDDPSVADVVRGRFGREVAERLVEPLIAGIHAGRADRLSLAAVAPQVAGPAAANRSILLGLRKATRPPAVDPGPVFLGLRGGLERLVDKVVERLSRTDIRVGAPIEALDELEADATVLTVPAYAAAPLLGGEVAAELEAIDYASVVTVTLAYPAAVLRDPLPGSGFLVPRVDGRLITACTWMTSKWPELAAGADGRVFLRASAGRLGDDRAIRLDDEELVERVHADLVQAMGLRAAYRPDATLVSRWPSSFPQYDVGHQARVERIEKLLPPGVVLAGAAYRGVGIAACIHDAQRAAAAVLASVDDDRAHHRPLPL